MLWSGRVFFCCCFFFFTLKKKSYEIGKKKSDRPEFAKKSGRVFFFFSLLKKKKKKKRNPDRPTRFKNLCTWGQHNIFFFGLTQKKNFQMINCGKCARASERSKISYLWPPRRVISSWGWGGEGAKASRGRHFLPWGWGGALPKSMGAHKLHKRKSEHRRRKVYFCGFERAKRARKK